MRPYTVKISVAVEDIEIKVEARTVADALAQAVEASGFEGREGRVKAEVVEWGAEAAEPDDARYGTSVRQEFLQAAERWEGVAEKEAVTAVKYERIAGRARARQTQAEARARSLKTAAANMPEGEVDHLEAVRAR